MRSCSDAITSVSLSGFCWDITEFDLLPFVRPTVVDGRKLYGWAIPMTDGVNIFVNFPRTHRSFRFSTFCTRRLDRRKYMAIVMAIRRTMVVAMLAVIATNNTLCFSCAFVLEGVPVASDVDATVVWNVFVEAKEEFGEVVDDPVCTSVELCFVVLSFPLVPSGFTTFNSWVAASCFPVLSSLN